MGRPPLSPSGPLTPEQLAERRKISVRRARLGEKRRRAVSCRRDRQPPAIKMKCRSKSVGGGRREQAGDEGERGDEAGDEEEWGEEAGEEGERREQTGEEREKGEVVVVKVEVNDEEEKLLQESETEKDEVTVDEMAVKPSEPEEKSRDAHGGKYGAMSKSDWFRKLMDLRAVVGPHNDVEKCDIVVKLLLTSELLPVKTVDAKIHLSRRLSRMTDWKLRDRVERLMSILGSSKEPRLLVRSLVQGLLVSSTATCQALLLQAGLDTRELIARELQAMETSKRLAQELLARRRGLPRQSAAVSVEHGVAVVQELGLSSEVRGDETILAKAISCTRQFAGKLLRAVEDGDVATLGRRSPRLGEIKCTEYPALLREFCFREENSRPVPGLETVSVGRNLPRQPKRLYNRSREEIIAAFRAENPGCPFKRSVLMRELPQECRTPSTRDMARNCCVACTNTRHRMQRLRKAGLLVDMVSSTRAVAARRVCSSGAGFDPLAVLSWQEECAMGHCADCQQWEVVVPEGRGEEVVTLALWGEKFCPIKKKKIHGRFPETMTLASLVQSFNTELPKLTKHLYVAYRQHSSCKLLSNSLRPGEVSSQEDYQQNVTMILSEETTSAHMGANTKAFAMAPFRLRGRTPGGEPFSGGIIFISQDLNHDKCQVGRKE